MEQILSAVFMIDGKPRFIRDTKSFGELIEEKLGYEPAETFRELVGLVGDEPKCCGECDATYSIQEHYDDVLNNIGYLLTQLRVYPGCRAVLEEIRSIIRAEGN